MAREFLLHTDPLDHRHLPLEGRTFHPGSGSNVSKSTLLRRGYFTGRLRIVGRVQSHTLPESGENLRVEHQGRYGLARRFDPHAVTCDGSWNRVMRKKCHAVIMPIRFR